MEYGWGSSDPHIVFTISLRIYLYLRCCIRCGPDEKRILDVVPKEDGARNSGSDGESGRQHTPSIIPKLNILEFYL